MATLFELTQQMQSLELMLEETGGELTEDIEALWAETEESLRTKTDNYNRLIQKLTGEADVIDREIKRLTALKRGKENSVKRIKEHLVFTMQGFGIDTLEGEFCKMRLRSSESLDVDEGALLFPYEDAVAHLQGILPDYVSVDLKVSKTGIKDAVKAGQALPNGCEMVKNTNITIR